MFLTSTCFRANTYVARLLATCSDFRFVFVGSMDETPALNLKDANIIRRIVSNADGVVRHPSESSHLDCL